MQANGDTIFLELHSMKRATFNKESGEVSMSNDIQILKMLSLSHYQITLTCILLDGEKQVV
jgi:hypothetical protein